jgi:hypothetical protein
VTSRDVFGFVLLAAVLLALFCVVAFGDTRHAATVRAFKRLTGYPHGRPGFVVDHQLPLCLGGADATSNMVWEPTAESYTKDIFERRMCAAAATQGYRLVKGTP